jgi:hypothetical protein
MARQSKAIELRACKITIKGFRITTGTELRALRNHARGIGRDVAIVYRALDTKLNGT